MKSALIGDKMDHCHISEDVRYFIGGFKSSGESWDFKRFTSTSKDWYWVIFNDAEFKLFQQHQVLQVPRVKESRHGINWNFHASLLDVMYMVYLTVAHGM